MKTQELGEKLVAMVREQQFIEAIRELYAEDVESVEAAAMGPQDPSTRGKAAVIAKGEWWAANHELHAMEVEGPFPHGDDRFALIYRFDVTSKPRGGVRAEMREVGVYHVSHGSIVREEYFYAT